MSFTEKTIAELGAVISTPKLSEKLLSKPPFRFLHDIVTNFLKATGFPDGLYAPDMLDSSKVTEKEGKLEFLRLLIVAVEAATGSSCSAKPAKIIAGQEPESTNQLLQLLASCASLSKEQKDAACQKAKGLDSQPEKEKAKEKPKETEEERHKRKEEERRTEKEKEKPKETDEERHKRKEEERRKEREKEKPKETEEERHKRKEEERRKEKEKEKPKETDEERHKRKEEERRKEKEKEEEQRREKEKEAQQREKENENQRKEKEKEDQRREKERENQRREREEQRREKEKEEQEREKEKEEERRKRREEERKKEKEQEKAKETEEELQKRKEEEQRKRKEEHRRKEKDRERDEEAQRHLESSSHMKAVIREAKPGEEAAKEPEKEEDDWQKVAEKYEHRSTMGAGAPVDVGEEDVKGVLGLQALKAKREQEEMQRKAEEAATSKGAGTGIVIRGVKGMGRAGTTIGENDLSKLRELLQMLTKASNPLGKFLEAIYDDIDSMIRELEMWRSECRNQALGAAEARRQTEESLQEVHAQLQSLEDGITDQILKTNHLHQNIIANDEAMKGMIKMIVNPDIGKN